MVYDIHGNTSPYQIEICPDRKVEAKYRSSKAISVLVGHALFEASRHAQSSIIIIQVYCPYGI
jgi:hypothetical protein